jgi:hypothetical protein
MLSTLTNSLYSSGSKAMISRDSKAASSSQVSTCRYCRFYHLEGRRGGHCSQLNVNVQSRWAACSLAQSTFVSALTQELTGEEAILEPVLEAAPVAISEQMVPR